MRKNVNVNVNTIENNASNANNATIGNIALVIDNTNKTDTDTNTETEIKDALVRSVMNNTYSICGKRIASVPIELMELDDSYQREVDKKNINHLFSDWDNDRCDFIIVSFRNGKFYIIDGQHRYFAAKLKGLKELPCIILIGLTRKQEARLFSRQNENVKKLTIYDVFKANIVNGDVSIPEIKIDMEINEVCKKHNIKITRSYFNKKNERNMKSLSAARKIVKVYGKEALEWIYDTIDRTNWKTCAEVTSRQIQDMLKSFYSDNKENLSYWQNTVENVMNTYTPAQIIGCARSDYANYTIGVAMNICFKELVNGNKIINVGVEK